MSSFSSWKAYTEFEREVCRNRRFVRSATADNFLEAVRSTIGTRVSRVSKGRGFWRAQVGHDWRRIEDIDADIPSAFSPQRMKPLADRAMEGRANPKGIPMLYLCSNKDAAMSEVRPWLGSMISLGNFVTTRDLRLIDCSRFPAKQTDVLFERPRVERWAALVWSEIDRAFTKPVTRSDDTGEYVATQILVELFRDEGFDGIAYQSAFGEKSKNFALFDLDAAELASCQLFEATSIKMNFQERDNPYWVKSSKRYRA